MRDILFRGKCINTGQWAYGNVYDEKKRGCKNRHTQCCPDTCADCPETFTKFIVYNHRNALGQFGTRYAPVNSVPVDPKTIGQFTGSIDKNGNKIFEGDIVLDDAITLYKSKGDNRPSLIKFDIKFCQYVWENPRAKHTLTTKCLFEVIGNIHDNPELLEEGEHGAT